MIRAVVPLAFIVIVWLPGSAHAGSPPPPPPTPGCGPCAGPPSPPTPVPTLGPSLNPTPVVVSVSLAPLRVHRGKWEKTVVKAEKSASVTIVVTYHRAKPVTYRGKVGGTGSYSKSWKIAKSAPLGKASVRIDLQGQSPYVSTLTFTVVH